MRIGLRQGAHHIVLNVQREGDVYRVHDGVADRAVRAEILGTQSMLIEADDKRYQIVFVREGDTFFLSTAGVNYTLIREQPTASGSHVAPIASPDIVAPMPGKVIQVLIHAGDQVTSGDTLLILEAMKMETRLLAEAAGVVESVCTKPGDLVDGGQLLAVIRYEEDGHDP